MDIPSQQTDSAGLPEAGEHRSSDVSGMLLRACGIGVTILFMLFLILPLLSLYFRAPLKLLRTAECCYIVREAAVLSLLTSLTTTGLTFVVGTPVAYTIASRQFRGRRILETVIELPLTLPPVVVGVALLLAFGRVGYLGRFLNVLGIQLPFTMVAVVMAQFMVASPHYVKTAIAAFEAVPQNLLRASQSLGAGSLRTALQITLPLCRRSLIAGLVLTWARAVGEFGATIMFAGNFPGRTQTMPLAILTTMQQNLHAGIVLAAAMLTISVGVFVLVRWLLPSTAPLPGWIGPRGAAQALDREPGDHHVR